MKSTPSRTAIFDPFLTTVSSSLAVPAGLITYALLPQNSELHADQRFHISFMIFLITLMCLAPAAALGSAVKDEDSLIGYILGGCAFLGLVIGVTVYRLWNGNNPYFKENCAEMMLLFGALLVMPVIGLTVGYTDRLSRELRSSEPAPSYNRC
jgi:uncharacterized membrane protein